jgi:phosphoglycolate phosphatase-like HAD superfamily hydrolase
LNVAIARLGVGAKATTMVGDTPYDARAADGAGIRAIGLACGGFPAIVLHRAGCSKVFRDVAQLLTPSGLSALGIE